MSRLPRPFSLLTCPALDYLALAYLALICSSCASRLSAPYTAAALHNKASLYRAPEDVFGRAESGWAIYAPRIARTIDATTPADTAAFARAVARWQAAHGLAATGEVDPATLGAMKAKWQESRPFVALRAAGICPDPPAAEVLVALTPTEVYGGEPLLLRRGALMAYRRMVRYGRGTQPLLEHHPELLQVFSAFRSPARDAARCNVEQNCQGVVRSACSAHRTGLAVDLVLDTAPGFAVDSSADANRLAMAQGFAYRWLLANAGRFGFVNYAFEPWHWEWKGKRP